MSSRVTLWLLPLLLSSGGGAFGSVLPSRPIPDIPLTARLGVGARAMGMAGAYTAVADDYSAIYYNPAGLAQIRSVELAGALDQRSQDLNVTYLGQTETTPADETKIHSLGFAYPFPTYRGALVIGFAYDRILPLDQAYTRSGSGGRVDYEWEEIVEDGGIGAYQMGCAVDVSPRLSLGATGTIYHGRSSRERTFVFDHSNGDDWERTYTKTDIDYSAVSGTLGALLRMEHGLRFGFSLHLPETFNLDGSLHDDVQRYQVTGDTLKYVDSFYFEDHIRLPFRISTGLSYAPSLLLPGLLLAVDLTFADWQEIDYDGPIRATGLGYAYRSTTDLRLGAEYAFSQAPLRLRAGFISQPLAYRPILSDVFMGLYDNARIERDRRYFTLGGGILLDRSLTLDFAWVRGSFERRNPSGSVVEKVDDTRLYLGAAFRI